MATQKKRCLMIGAGGMAILTEKPIADSWKDAVAIYRAVRRARVKCTVIQNYRYNPPMYTFRSMLREERLGRLNYIMGKFMADYRSYGAWSSFAGESNANYVMKMANGVIAHYEGSCSAAGKQNNWHQEYYRAECENGEIEVDNDATVRTTVRNNKTGKITTKEVKLRTPKYVGHSYVIDAHLKWISGGPKPETALDDNLHSNAAMFGAIEASRRGTVVDVEAMVVKATAKKP